MFDWQTEEDDVVWEEEPPKQQEPKRPLNRKWVYAIIPLLLLMGAGYFVYQQVQNQTDTAVSAIETDIVSSHKLLLDAIESKDSDLFQLLLSGRDMNWVAAHQEMIQAEELLSYSPMQLTYQPSSYEMQSITLTPSLESAEVEFSLTYFDAQRQPITLQQTAVFRRGETRWLYAPPESKFWGEWQTQAEQQFTVIYSERDAEWVESFADNLAQWLPQLCDNLPDLRCQEWEKSIRFDTAPSARLTISNQENLYGTTTQINLPTPSLIGLPTDAQSELFMQNAYKALLTRVFIADMLGYSCCEQAPMLHALLTYQLAQFGLAEWPVSKEMHLERWQQEAAPTLANIVPYWESSEVVQLPAEQAQELQLMVDFLLDFNADYSAVSLMDSLNSRIRTPVQWLNRLYFADVNQPVDRFTMDNYNNLWNEYANLQYSSQTILPDTLPAQTLTLVCVPIDNSTDDTFVYQYDKEAGEWLTLAELAGFGILFPLANDEQALMQSLPFIQNQPSNEIVLWSENSPITIKDIEDEYRISFGQMSNNGRFVTTYTFPTNLDTFNDARTIIYDLENCTAEGCRQINAPGSPVWSPDGTKVLFQQFESFEFVGRLAGGRIWQSEVGRPYTLLLSNAIPDLSDSEITSAFEAEAIGFGYAPFWIDNERYGYIEVNEERTSIRLVIGATDANTEPQITLTSDILNAISSDSTRTWRLSYASAIPNHENLLAVVASDGTSSGHLFLYDVVTNRITHALSNVRMDFEHLLSFSGDGRYIATATTNPNIASQSRKVTILNLENLTTNVFSMGDINIFPGLLFDWSLDSDWFAIETSLDFIQLIHVPTNESYILKHPHGQCSAISWTGTFLTK